LARLLLDSHALLWFMAGDRRRISAAMRKTIEAGAMISAASLWEIAIKSALGKLEAPESLPQRLVENGFELLPITADHAWQVRSLPHHHRDPFDRLLIAQAQVEHLSIASADPAFADYDVVAIWE
jgi:PIN domain nuclease of toxin-antitoxin system